MEIFIRSNQIQGYLLASWKGHAYVLGNAVNQLKLLPNSCIRPEVLENVCEQLSYKLLAMVYSIFLWMTEGLHVCGIA